MPTRMRTALLTAATTVAVAPSAHAAQLVVNGHGFGHGVGMSQWGAHGYAEHGAGYQAILAHYYTGTSITHTAQSAPVRVLIQQRRASVKLRGASGSGLRASTTYTVRSNGLEGTVVRTSSGRVVARTDGPLRVGGSAGAPVQVLGSAASSVHDGAFRGTIEVHPTVTGRLDTIDELGLEDYVRGVVAGESPASWPAEALKAQAVAARTYALTTKAGGSEFDQYSDTRSQVYQGVHGETPQTDAAVAATAGDLVTVAGKPVTTYFFSTSGGRTENVENSFLGDPPASWLKSVDDPYESDAPLHTWRRSFSLGAAQRNLGSLVSGRLRSIDVVQRGASPRVVKAQVVGSRGRTTVTGPQLRAKLGLPDTWATFTIVR